MLGNQGPMARGVISCANFDKTADRSCTLARAFIAAAMVGWLSNAGFKFLYPQISGFDGVAPGDVSHSIGKFQRRLA